MISSLPPSPIEKPTDSQDDLSNITVANNTQSSPPEALKSGVYHSLDLLGLDISDDPGNKPLGNAYRLEQISVRMEEDNERARRLREQMDELLAQMEKEK
ncbi:hypothetical protein JXD20_01615 [Candidatus Peregrinibacteria bacterium]|nr:hypothetical protein [Candidatus Peregrinibacteria bacterium]